MCAQLRQRTSIRRGRARAAIAGALVSTGFLLTSFAKAVGSPDQAIPPFSPPTGSVRLSDAVAAALLNSPELSVFSWQIRVQEARAVQAGLLPNPELAAEIEDVGGTGDREAFEKTQITISIAQLIELGGQRAKRLRLASLTRDLASWDYEVARANVLAAVAKAFTATLAAQNRLKLFDELVAVAQRSIDAVAAQVKAGATSPIELARAEAALGRTQAQRWRAERDLAVSRLALAVTWGGSSVTFSEVLGNLGSPASPPELAVLLARIEDNPDLARWSSELEQRRAVLNLEQARAVPSLTVAVGGRQFTDNGDTALVAGLSIPLPIFDRNQGNIMAAQRQAAQAAAQRDFAAVTVRQALGTAYEDLRAAYGQAATLRDTVLPKAEAAFAGARDAYQRGLLRFLDVLDAQRTLFEVRDDYLRTLASYFSALVDLERLSGAPISTDPDAVRSNP